MRENQHRAEYWLARGYRFNPLSMTADSMDRYVENHERATYWAERGYKFDPRKMSAYAMDRQAESYLRAKYWKRWGIKFDADKVDAATMDETAAKLQQVQSELEGMINQPEQKSEPAIELEALPDTEPTRELGEAPDGALARSSIGPSLPPMNFGAGLGGVGGQGQGRGNAGAGGGTPLGNAPGSRGTGAGFSIPPGIEDPEAFLEFLRRAGL